MFRNSIIVHRYTPTRVYCSQYRHGTHCTSPMVSILSFSYNAITMCLSAKLRIHSGLISVFDLVSRHTTNGRQSSRWNRQWVQQKQNRKQKPFEFKRINHSQTSTHWNRNHIANTIVFAATTCYFDIYLPEKPFIFPKANFCFDVCARALHLLCNIIVANFLAELHTLKSSKSMFGRNYS